MYKASKSYYTVFIPPYLALYSACQSREMPVVVKWGSGEARDGAIFLSSSKLKFYVILIPPIPALQDVFRLHTHIRSLLSQGPSHKARVPKSAPTRSPRSGLLVPQKCRNIRRAHTSCHQGRSFLLRFTHGRKVHQFYPHAKTQGLTSQTQSRNEERAIIPGLLTSRCRNNGTYNRP